MSEAIRDFHKRHGADQINVDGWLLWPNGAMREANAYGALIDPPADPWECAKKVLWYWTCRLKRAVADFDAAKANLRAVAAARMRDGGDPPDADQLKNLKALKAEVERVRAQHAKAHDAERAAIPADIRAHWAQREKNQKAAQDFLSAVNEVTV